VRNDAVGFFWDDTPPPKPPKAEKEKRTPPEAVWLADDYLPGLEEALRFPVHVMTDQELAEAKARGDEFVYDTEAYSDYWLALFTSLTTGHVAYVECSDGQALDRDGVVRLRWMLDNFRTSGFNSLSYDNTMSALALAGLGTEQLKQVSDELIILGARPADVLKRHKVKKLRLNHIDIMDVCPLDGSLKTYAGRVHAPKLQDLPFPPSTRLGPLRRAIVRWYCYNDTVSTAFVRQHQEEHVQLRVQLSNQHGVDLRSKSDAQLGEVIIAKELEKLTGVRPKPPGPLSAVGQKFHYQPPAYISFQSPDLQQALAEMCAAEIEVMPSGHCRADKEIQERTVVIGGRPYKVGIGGLHSKEKRQTVVADDNTRVIDRDVTGYYPNLILKNGYFPPHLGRLAQVTYQSIVDRRENAKPQLKSMEKAGQTSTSAYEMLNAEVGGLKIACNGAMFGKTSDPWSILYAPAQMVHITITGQLSLLMAIEALELSGIPVVSANTDGIVMACPRDKYDHMCAVFAGWEQITALRTEETEYAGLYMANVNNYIALTLDGKTKTKGWYCERGSAQNSILSKNPDVLVCSEAVQAYLAEGVPLEQSIRGCTDMRKFVSLRVVRGGGVKVWDEGRPPQYLGKTVRWYYGLDVPGHIVYAASGNIVPRSEGAVPCMELPARIPDDLDYGWYIEKAEAILCNIGAASDSHLHLDCTASKCRYSRQEDDQ
jgi:hypothetical protein